MMNVADLSVDQLNNLVENHRRKGATDQPLYRDALRELEERTCRGLSFEKSFAAIRQAAIDGRFLSYKDLAEASGVPWHKVRWEVGPHLGRLVDYGHRMDWPMLSAIVVNQQNVSTGRMEPEALKGFMVAAHMIGRLVTDLEAFLREQQREVFEWGAKQREASEEKQ